MMVGLLLLLLAPLLFLLLPLWLGRADVGRELLDASFAEQTVPVAGGTIPAATLTVVNRVPGMVVTRGYGAIVQLDAQWLCRTADGRWLLAIAQGMRSPNEAGLFGHGPLPVHWTWRDLDDAQAQRLMKGRGRWAKRESTFR
jgi:hypothetical protein